MAKRVWGDFKLQWVGSGGVLWGGEGRLDMLLDPWCRYRAYKLFLVWLSTLYENFTRTTSELVFRGRQPGRRLLLWECDILHISTMGFATAFNSEYQIALS